MKNYSILFILLFSIAAFSQKTTDTIASLKLKEDRIIDILLPASYEKNPEKKYPLLLLLDGDYLFNPFSGAITYANYWDDLPEVIIVGLHQNKNNERDTDCEVDNESGLPTKKGAQFFEFIAGELLPTLEKSFRIAPFKIIAGHDYTAGFLNVFLYKDQPIFNAYISLSPQFPAQMEERIPSRLSQFKMPIFYYQSSADGDLKEDQKLIRMLDANVKSTENKNLFYKYDDFKNASHYSMVLYSIPSALYHIFSSYQPISTNEYHEKIAVLPNDYVGYLSKKYNIIEKLYGIKMPIRVNDFKAIEAAILKNKAFNELEELSILARKSYPKSMLADYELGLMFEKKGDNKRALKYYQGAFQKDEIGDLTKDMMMEKVEILKKTLPEKGKNKAAQNDANGPESIPTEEKKSE